MQVTFRPNKHNQEVLKRLTEKGQKSRFINQAIEFYSSFQPVLTILENLVNNQKEMSKAIVELKEKINEITAISIFKEHSYRDVTLEHMKEDKSKEDEDFLAYLLTGVNDISDS